MKKAIEVQPVETKIEAEPVREPEQQTVKTKPIPGHYVVRQMNGCVGPVIVGDFSGDSSWYDAQECFRSTHGYVELWQVMEGPVGTFRWCISSKKSSGRKAILN